MKTVPIHWREQPLPPEISANERRLESQTPCICSSRCSQIVRQRRIAHSCKQAWIPRVYALQRCSCRWVWSLRGGVCPRTLLPEKRLKTSPTLRRTERRPASNQKKSHPRFPRKGRSEQALPCRFSRRLRALWRNVQPVKPRQFRPQLSRQTQLRQTRFPRVPRRRRQRPYRFLCRSSQNQRWKKIVLSDKHPYR